MHDNLLIECRRDACQLLRLAVRSLDICSARKLKRNPDRNLMGFIEKTSQFIHFVAIVIGINLLQQSN